MGERVKKCLVENGILEMCKGLDKALHPEANARGKGAHLLVLRNVETGEVTRTGAVLQSGVYSKRGVVMNFCPFCGNDISSQFRKGGGDNGQNARDL